MWICIVHCGKHAFNALPLPVRQHWSPQASLSARHQRTLQDHGYDLMYYALCLFTHPAFAGYSWQPTHRERVQAE